MSSFNLTGKTCLITGAGTGLARAMALGLAQAGAQVLAADIDEAGLAETARMAQGAPGQIVAHVLDVREQTQCEAAVARAIADFEPTEVLRAWGVG
jgi:NAD(P)-dependent dehydrogenase (short-subunit alcohol dehydrogenase family)